MTKLQKALNWIGARHPDLENVMYPGEERGFSKSTFYKALGILREEKASAYTGPKDVPVEDAFVKGIPAEAPYIHLITEMEQKLGLVEMHYKDGVLEVLQRRRIKVH